MTTKEREKFNDLFKPLESKIKLIMNSGSFLSGATLGMAAFIISMHLSADYHLAARLIPSITIALVVAFLVEGSIRLLTPVLITQVVRWDFYDKYFRGMFSIILFMLIGCYAVSGVFSVIGSRHLVSIVSKVPDGKDINMVSSPFDNELSDIRKDFNKQETAINKAAKDNIKAIEKKYNTQITQKRKQAKKLKDSGKPGHNWLINSVIPQLNKSMHSQIETVNAKKSTQITELNAARQKAQERISTQKGVIVHATVKENQHKALTARERINKAGYGLAVLTVLGLVAFFVCCAIIVLIKTGGTQGPAPAPNVIPVSNTETRPREIERMKRERLKVKPESESKILNSSALSVPVDGFSGTFTVDECRDKISQYHWKLDNNKGRIETNNKNIAKFEDAILLIKKQLK